MSTARTMYMLLFSVVLASASGMGMHGIGPAWTNGAMEAPACEKKHDSWVQGVYCREQQARLSVNENGEKVSRAALVDATGDPYAPPKTTYWSLHMTNPAIKHCVELNIESNYDNTSSCFQVRFRLRPPSSA